MSSVVIRSPYVEWPIQLCCPANNSSIFGMDTIMTEIQAEVKVNLLFIYHIVGL